MSFQEPDPDIPVLALIVNSAGGDILRFQLAEDYPASITELSEWSGSLLRNQELHSADCRLTRDCLTSSTKNSSVNYFCNCELLLQNVRSEIQLY